MENEEKKLITVRDVRSHWLRYYMTCEMGISYERLQAVGLCSALVPVLKKLYPDKKELSKALQRHLVFYNTEAVFGSLINGIVIAMEEQKANGEPIEDETITSLKTGLMGPLAGIGDSIDWATLKPIIFALAATLSATGNPIGCFVLLALPVIQIAIGLNLSVYGYKAGRSSIRDILNSGRIKELILGASTLGLFMMGALSSTYVKLATPVVINFGKGNEPFILQNVIDGIVPGLLPLAAVLGIYWWLNNKNQKMIMIMLIILAVSLIGAVTGLL